MRILQVNSSARGLHDGQGSVSSLLAGELVAQLQARHPDAVVTVRDLSSQPHPVLDEAALQALFTSAEQRTAAQSARVALDDALISEIQAADAVVLAVPMFNFGITSQLKNWIDAISRARVTFQYTAHGPEGLLTGKTVYVVLTRGGVYRDQPADTQVPYLRQVLGFLGMTDVRFAYAEGLAMGDAAIAASMASAREQMARLLEDRCATESVPA
jgi:FMN-dependent NADH-azoreductase